MLRVQTSPNPIRDAGVAISRLLVETRHTDVLLLVSGGSALALLDKINHLFLSPRVTVSVLDERYTHDEQGSNYARLLTTTFWRRAQEMHVSTIDPRPLPNETLEMAGTRMHRSLLAWHAAHPKGVVIATMGIGVDGHTAGIFPQPDVLSMAEFISVYEDKHLLACGYTVPDRSLPFPERLTVTNNYLRTCVDHAIVYVVGEEKHAALTALHDPIRKLAQTPACIMREMHHVEIYTDIQLTAQDTGKSHR